MEDFDCGSEENKADVELSERVLVLLGCVFFYLKRGEIATVIFGSVVSLFPFLYLSFTDTPSPSYSFTLPHTHSRYIRKAYIYISNAKNSFQFNATVISIRMSE